MLLCADCLSLGTLYGFTENVTVDKALSKVAGENLYYTQNAKFSAMNNLETFGFTNF